jgi:DNA polymerase III delta prime subunit
VTKFLDSGKLPHLLFYGPPGTGKTTTILALARRMFGSGAALASNVLEVLFIQIFNISQPHPIFFMLFLFYFIFLF